MNNTDVKSVRGCDISIQLKAITPPSPDTRALYYNDCVLPFPLPHFTVNVPWCNYYGKAIVKEEAAISSKMGRKIV